MCEGGGGDDDNNNNLSGQEQHNNEATTTTTTTATRTTTPTTTTTTTAPAPAPAPAATTTRSTTTPSRRATRRPFLFHRQQTPERPIDGIDQPPIIHGTINSSSSSSCCKLLTPQKLVTLEYPSSGGGSNSLCHGLLLLQRYLLVYNGNKFCLHDLQYASSIFLQQIHHHYDNNLHQQQQQKQKQHHHADTVGSSTSSNIQAQQDQRMLSSPKATLSIIDNNDDDQDGPSSLSSVSMVQLVLAPSGFLNTSNDENNTNNIISTVVALSIEGDIYIINLLTSENNDNVELSLVHTWNTNTCGVTCCAISQSDSNINGDKVIMVGYDSGHVEAWQITIPQQRAQSTTETPKKNRFTTRLATKQTAPPPSKQAPRLRCKLNWRGSLATRSIRSMAILQVQKNYTPDISTTIENIDTNPSNNDIATPDYLIVTLQPRSSTTYPIPTSSMIEVLNLQSITNFVTNNNDDFATVNIPLEHYLILPEIGMELLDPYHRRQHNNNHNNNNNIIPTITNNTICTGLQPGMTGVTLPDGTVALICASIYQENNGNNKLSWGITQGDHQLTLSYPSIGCSTLRFRNQNYMTCCLRGGTCYLIPTKNNDNNNINNEMNQKQNENKSTKTNNDNKAAKKIDKNTTFAILYPHNIDHDSQSQYVQGFTAGTLELSPTVSLPILVYMWPGGIIDVYSCELLQHQQEKDSEIREIIQSLLDNGTVATLLGILQDPQTYTPLFDLTDWKSALEEYKQLEVKTLGTRNKIKQSPAIESLLLSLAKIEHNP